jgi:hypothetical protein
LGLGVAVGMGVAVSFGVGVTYLGDTSSISPTMSGSAVAWRLPDIGFLGSSSFGCGCARHLAHMAIITRSH